MPAGEDGDQGLINNQLLTKDNPFNLFAYLAYVNAKRVDLSQ